jgi:hypothetical protein
MRGVMDFPLEILYVQAAVFWSHVSRRDSDFGMGE